MPMPWSYRHASKEFRAFLEDVKERMSLSSDNSAYTAVDGVLQTFRRRLTAQQGLDFANVLPSVLRAIFVYEWNTANGQVPYADRRAMTEEAQSLRRDHNLTPDNAIEATAWAVRRCTNRIDFERVLRELGPEAEAFWHVDVADKTELDQRIV